MTSTPSASHLRPVPDPDGHRPPFGDGEFDAVISLFTHTDFDDLDAALAEAARVLKPAGDSSTRVLTPALGAPMVARGAAQEIEDAVAILRPGYTTPGWRTLPADPASVRVRARVGINHVPLSTLLNAIVGQGFSIDRVEEPGGDDPPIYLTLRAHR
jgi:SAM-dependent methyltransferase